MPRNHTQPVWIKSMPCLSLTSPRFLKRNRPYADTLRMYFGPKTPRLFLSLLLGLFFFSALAKAEDFHVVFDIDWTLVYPLENAPLTPDPNMVEVEGKWYRFSDHAGESIEKLAQEPGVKVSFFSGGEKSRNLKLLEKLKLPSGQNALSLAHKVLHAEDMTVVSEDKTKKFSERFKKDLTKISTDLDRIILIDDVKHFTVPGQEKNLVWLGDTYNYAASYQEARLRARTRPQYEAPSHAAWKSERAKISRVSESVLKRVRTLRQGTGTGKLWWLSCERYFAGF